MLAQTERDDRIEHLLEVMTDVYAFILEAKDIKKMELHEKTLAIMAQQTTECAYFIRTYSTYTNFGMSVFVSQLAKSNCFSPKESGSLKMPSRILTARLNNTRTSSGSSTWHFNNELSSR
jgi:hypothetical protein